MKSPDNGWDKRKGLGKHGHGTGRTRRHSTVGGQLYSEIRYERCPGCPNSKPTSQDRCDRCLALRELKVKPAA